ncbi:MAG: hypothetical protein UHD05_04220, partial [Ruminococcus sp.]|nr:hypothetical protein [Ruminococcus sp.]
MNNSSKNSSLMNEIVTRKNHFINSSKNIYEKFDESFYVTKKSRRLLTILYFPIVIMWMEIMVKLSSGFSVFGGFFFTLIFTIPISCILTILFTISKSEKVNRRIAFGITAFLAVWYCAQLVYNNVFGTFFVINSITNGGTGQALNSVDMILTAIRSRFFFILLTFLPLIIGLILGRRIYSFKKTKGVAKIFLVVTAVIVHLLGTMFVNFDAGSADTKSNYNLYNGELQQNAVCERFGLFTMQRIDISRMLFGYKSTIRQIEEPVQETTAPASENMSKKQEPHIIETDFVTLSENAASDDLKELYDYFNSATPSSTNEYTGMFKDYNVIFLTAESFSHYCIDKELTPTLYKMYSEGFQFENFYSPAWGVSTTDGEYANLTGLIPKSGVWSFSQSAEQNISFPFTLGEQARTIGVEEVRAYHNHTYDYYDRDQYLTNIGYDYSAIGKGLDLGEDVWPNSDLKMMQQTVKDYVNADSFSVYYMTVSGHGGYSYNTISERNAELVKHLEYSDEVKGYL